MPDTAHHIPFDKAPDTWVFDLDNTLYPAACDLFKQVETRIGSYVSTLLGLPRDQAYAVQKQYFHAHGTTLAGLMHHHDTDPQHYLDFVHDIDFSVLPPDPALAATLSRISGRKLIFTNADTDYAEKVLAQIGIADQFEAIYDIRAGDLAPKPAPATYDKFLRLHNVVPDRAMMFEDMARNLVPAHALGMKTVWVKTDNDWGAADHDATTIHAETDNLTSWLSAALDQMAEETTQ